MRRWDATFGVRRRMVSASVIIDKLHSLSRRSAISGWLTSGRAMGRWCTRPLRRGKRCLFINSAGTLGLYSRSLP